MNDERVEELLFTISNKLSSIEAKVTSTQETLLRHESRITSIEDKIGNCYRSNGNNKNDSRLKDQLLALLAKSVVIALTALATLAGASGILPKIAAM